MSRIVYNDIYKNANSFKGKRMRMYGNHLKIEGTVRFCEYAYNCLSQSQERIVWFCDCIVLRYGKIQKTDFFGIWEKTFNKMIEVKIF